MSTPTDPGYQTADQLVEAAQNSDPAPVGNTPADPAPVDPTPTEPAEPVDPTPAEPAEPVDPDPAAEPSAEDETSFSDQQVNMLRNFKRLSPEDRRKKVENIRSANKPDQVAMIPFFEESFEIAPSPVTPVSPDPAVPADPAAPQMFTQDQADELVRNALVAQGLTPEAIDQMNEQRELAEQSEALKEWSELVSVDVAKLSKDRTFVTAYHRADGSVEQRVNLAVKAYLKANPAKSRAKAVKTAKATQTKGGTPAAPAPKTGYQNVRAQIGGKTLDELAAA